MIISLSPSKSTLREKDEVNSTSNPWLGCPGPVRKKQGGMWEVKPANIYHSMKQETMFWGSLEGNSA